MYSAHPVIEDLAGKTISREKVWKDSGSMTKRYVDKSGRSRIDGGPKLKSSQAYPLGFGRAVASCYCAHKAKLEHGDLAVIEKRPAPVGLNEVWGPLTKKARWEDAKLGPVFKYISGGGNP